MKHDIVLKKPGPKTSRHNSVDSIINEILSSITNSL